MKYKQVFNKIMNRKTVSKAKVSKPSHGIEPPEQPPVYVTLDLDNTLEYIKLPVDVAKPVEKQTPAGIFEMLQKPRDPNASEFLKSHYRHKYAKCKVEPEDIVKYVDAFNEGKSPYTLEKLKTLGVIPAYLNIYRISHLSYTKDGKLEIIIDEDQPETDGDRVHADYGIGHGIQQSRHSPSRLTRPSASEYEGSSIPVDSTTETQVEIKSRPEFGYLYNKRQSSYEDAMRAAVAKLYGGASGSKARRGLERSRAKTVRELGTDNLP